MNRRMFLQGMGGLALTIPTLTSLLPRTAQAQTAASNMRFLIINNWYGRDYRKWYAHDDKAVTKVATNGGYAYRTLSDLPGDISQILPSSVWDASLRKKMTMVRGLDCVDIHDGHNFSMSTSATLEGGDRDYHRFPYSIDAVIEGSTKFYPTAPRVGAIRMSPVGNMWNLENSLWTYSWTSKSGRAQDLPSLSWPHTLYQKYFSQVVVDQTQQRAQRLQVVTNSVYQDYSKVMGGTQISAADRHRLDHYMQLLSQAEKKLGVVASRSGGVCAAPASASGLPTKYNGYANSSYMYETIRDLMTVAFACGMTKLGMMNQFLLGDDIANDNPQNDKFHDCAHNPDGQKYGFPALNMNRFLYDHSAKFLKQLDSVMDSDGNTLLDNTLVYIANDDSTGGHYLADMPVILAGAKGVLKTDMMIDYRNLATTKVDGIYLGRPYNNLLVTLFRALGLGPETYKMTPDQKGFGYVARTAASTANMWGTIRKTHYAPFMTDAEKDAVLPGLLVGG